MENKLLHASLVAVLSALVNAQPPSSAPMAAEQWTWWTTTGSPGKDLYGRMFTLSERNRGGVSFYPPFYKFSTPNGPHDTYPRSGNTHLLASGYYPPWTTPSPPTGVTVCLRYLIDSTKDLKIFTLSPTSSAPLTLSLNGFGAYTLTFERQGLFTLSLRPFIWFWSNVGTDFWFRVCVTVDTVKNEAQLFSGSNMSIRKLLPIPFAWSGEPVIDFSGFDGQVTDLQVWDYPLSYTDIVNYMSSSSLYQGSVITWSSVCYSARGKTLLELAYQRKQNQPISSKGCRQKCRREWAKKGRTTPRLE